MDNNLNCEKLSQKEEQRFQAVFAMLKGEFISDIVEKHKICRSDLYKFRKRALIAMREAMYDLPRGPKTPHNRLPKAKEEQIEQVCRRYPAMSSYKISEKVGTAFSSPRTIQRVRDRLSLKRLLKRAPRQSKAKRFPPETKQKMLEFILKQGHLGVLRLSWDIANILKIAISPSTLLRWRKAMIPKVSPVIEIISWQYYERKHPHSLWHGDVMKFEHSPDRGLYLRQLTFLDDYSRAYVYSELTTQTTASYTVQCLIYAMREWKVIPKALLFDNGSEFRGDILKTFCNNLCIRIIYSTVNHPQTNGKLERAFRDDRRDFYAPRSEWPIERMQEAFPDYMYYRNYQRGHFALEGRPAITRLLEQDRFASESILEHLEEYAVNEIGEKMVNTYGYIRLFCRWVYVGEQLKKSRVRCFETIRGLEIRKDGLVIGVLQDYYLYKTLTNTLRSDEIPESIILQQPYQHQLACPRIAVAL